MKSIKRRFNLLRYLDELNSGVCTVFMLHRVNELEKNKLSLNENLKISPHFLDSFIINLKNKGFNFISLDELFSILKSGKSARKKVVFTLDDGYKDNYISAYPIFKKHNVPFTIYVSTSFPDQKAILWWYILEDLIIKENSISLMNAQKFECITKSQKEMTFLKIRDIILKLGKENFIDNLSQLFNNYCIDWYSKSKEMAMSWDEVIELSNYELCTIASHTDNHLSLNKLSTSEELNEIVTANKKLELKTGKKIEHFAYPFGSQNEASNREYEIVKTLGFKTATTTIRGNIFKYHKNQMESLPRIMLTENFSLKKIRMIQFQSYLLKILKFIKLHDLARFIYRSIKNAKY